MTWPKTPGHLDFRPHATLWPPPLSRDENQHKLFTYSSHPESESKLPIVKTRNSNAFTLIELLVVLAITALLIPLLPPTIDRARGLAHDLHCANNPRQVGVGLHRYFRPAERRPGQACRSRRPPPLYKHYRSPPSSPPPRPPFSSSFLHLPLPSHPLERSVRGCSTCEPCKAASMR